MLSNPMKRKLLAGEPAFGVSVMFPSPHVVDMVGRLGFDWVLIDCEHGSISIESVEFMVLAAEAAGITPIARPQVNSFEAICQLMDRGVMGVQVPHVNNAADARRAVEAVKYHPLGERGLAAGLRSSSYGFGVSMSEYAEESNRETLVCVQLEEGEAVRNVDEIMSVEGVDVYFRRAVRPLPVSGVPGQARYANSAGGYGPRVLDGAGQRQDIGVGRQCCCNPGLPGPGRNLSVHPPDCPAFRRGRSPP